MSGGGNTFTDKLQIENIDVSEENMIPIHISLKYLQMCQLNKAVEVP